MKKNTVTSPKGLRDRDSLQRHPFYEFGIQIPGLEVELVDSEQAERQAGGPIAGCNTSAALEHRVYPPRRHHEPREDTARSVEMMLPGRQTRGSGNPHFGILNRSVRLRHRCVLKEPPFIWIASELLPTLLPRWRPCPRLLDVRRPLHVCTRVQNEQNSVRPCLVRQPLPNEHPPLEVGNVLRH